MRLPVMLVVLVSALLSSVVSGQAEFEAGTEYEWHGSVTVPPSTEVRMSFRYVAAEDSGEGFLTISDQGVSGAKVSELETGDGRLKFALLLEGIPEGMEPRFDLARSEDNTVLEGVIQQSGMEFPAKFSMKTEEELAAENAVRRPQTPVPPFKYRTEELVSMVVTNKGMHTLAGTLTLPNEEEFGAGPYTTAVFITGSGAQDRDETLFDHKPFAVIADYLARKGIASLRSDDRGVYGSTGDPVNPTTYDFVDDAQAQVDQLMLDPRIGKIGLIGHSEGGVVGPMVAIDNEDVAFVVMLAGTGVPGKEVLIEQTARLLEAAQVPAENVVEARVIQTEVLTRAVNGENPEDMRELLEKLIQAQTPVELADDVLGPAADAAIAQMSIPWMSAFLKLDPRVALRMVAQPVLVLNGDMDLQVLYDQNVPEIEKALADNPDVTVRVFPGLNHMFQRCENGSIGEYATLTTTIEPEVLDLITGWILERFGK